MAYFKIEFSGNLQLLKSENNRVEKYVSDVEHITEPTTRFHVDCLKNYIKTFEKSLPKAEGEEIDQQEMEEASKELFRAKELLIQLQLVALKVEETKPLKKSDEIKGENTQPQNFMPFQHLPLPTYSGNIMEFTSFWEMFQVSIDNTAIDDVIKFRYLKESLSGEPRELIDGFPLLASNYSPAVKLLHETYGDTKRMITRLYNNLKDLPKADETTSSLKKTYLQIEGIIRSLEKFRENPNKNEFIRSLVLSKYPEDVLFRVCQLENPALDQFRQIIKQYVDVRENLAATTFITAPTVVRSSAQPKTFNTSASSTGGYVKQSNDGRAPRLMCIYCGQLHWSDTCSSYTTVTDRKSRLNGKCHKCLRVEHAGKACEKARVCVYCQQETHHRSLCPTKFGEEKIRIQSPKGTKNAEPEKVNTAFTTAQGGNFLTLCTRIKNPLTQKFTKVRLAFDTASSRSLLDKSAANRLGIALKTEKIQLKGLGGVTVQTESTQPFMISVERGKAAPINLEVYAVNKIADEVPSANIEKFRKDFPQFDSLEIPETGDGKPVELLIGCEECFSFFTLEKSIRVRDSLHLVGTYYGWLISGKQEKSKLSDITFFTTDDPIEKLWKLDTLGIAEEEPEIKNEEKALEQFYKSIQFREGRYEVAWPWREYPPPLPTNYGLAMGRLKSLYTTLNRNELLFKEYHKIIVQQVEAEIIEMVPDNAPIPVLAHYIPHRAVLTPEKSTPIRIVYDASAQLGKKQRSLNSCLLKGKKWSNDIIHVLLKFLKNDTALTADVSKAFHQIGIVESDRDVTRFLWLKDIKKPPTDDNIQIFRFKRVAFGIVSSPFLLMATIHYHFIKLRSKNSEIVLQDLYADNLVSSLPSSINAEQFYTEVREEFAKMAMNLRLWRTNNLELKAQFEKEDRTAPEITNVLGLEWNTQTDTLSLKNNLPEATSCVPTKRSILKETASVFDPLGWVSPVILEAKLLLKELWEAKMSWDAPIGPEYQAKWTRIFASLKQTVSLQLPRRILPTTNVEDNTGTEFHIFVDASAAAYAAVLYLRIDNYVRIVSSKARVSPPRKLTIPRLELLAILIGARLLRFVRNGLKINKVRSYLWSDSKCALAWLKTSKILPTIVEKQINEIKQVEFDQYRYVPSEINPADIASRGTDMKTLSSLNWWTGPTWLCEKNNWPAETNLPEMDDVTLLIQDGEDTNKEPPLHLFANMRQFSTMKRLLKVTAFFRFSFYKWFKKWADKKNRTFERLNEIDQMKTDYENAEKMWIKADQERYYFVIFERLQTQKKLPKPLRKLRLFIDDITGFLRCRTRLDEAEIQENEKTPILLAAKSVFTKLLILKIHTENMHMGTAYTLASIREQFWVPQGRQKVYKTIHNDCMQCRKHLVAPFRAPPIAPLPKFRVTPTSTAFENTGLDVFGPFFVRVSVTPTTPREKRWILIFTCLVTRAVHMEVLSHLYSSDFLHAFRRFVARRTTPQLLVSDNAKQFHLLNNVLHELWTSIAENKETLQYFAEKKIKWKFIPQHSPWMGGVYERLIQIVKTAIKRTYGKISFSERQLVTIITEIEAMINSRPLTYVDRDLQTPVITPNDFIKVKFPAIPINKKEEESTKKEAEKLSSREKTILIWKKGDNYLQEIWREWSLHYLRMLRERTDSLKQPYRTTNRVPKVNEIVIVDEGGQSRNEWKFAVVEELIPSSDGQIRAVGLRWSSGMRTVRPITKIAPMELNIDDENEENEEQESSEVIEEEIELSDEDF